MQIQKIFSGVALSMLIGAGLVSCSNEMPSGGAVNNADNTVLVKAPKVTAYSGSHFWDQYDSEGSLVAYANAGVTAEPCETTLIDRDKEAKIVDEYLPEKNENLELHPDLDADFLFYADKDLSLEFYPVYSQTSTQNDLGVFYWDAEGNYHEVVVWEGMTQWNVVSSEWKWDAELQQTIEVKTTKGVKVNVPAGCTFGFFWKGNLNNETSPSETTYYSMSEKNTEVYCTDGNGNHIQPEKTSKVHAVTFTLDGKTYLGLEDWTDFDYQDWVFTCDQELITVDASTFKPGTTPEPEQPEQPGEEPKDDNCDKCGHPSHDGNCDVCNPGDVCNPNDEVDQPGNDDPTDDPAETEPSAPGHKHTNEVEVNLGVDDKGDYKESHISIHVRAGTNVDVFIPVPLEYVCPADDMAIVKKHFENQMEHGGDIIGGTMDENGNYIAEGLLTHMYYKIGHWYIDLYVEFVAAGVPSSTGEVFAEDGFHIWTTNIDEELIAYLEENYGDGITFEVWNYYNDDIDMDTLKSYLDRSTIKFTDLLPDYYINAFGEDNFAEDKDCTVDIEGSQKGNYNDPYEGGHLNGSSHNQIYEKGESMPEPPTRPQPPVY